MDFVFTHLWQFWLIVSICCLIMELFSGGFYILSFAVGALPALLVAALGGSFYWQLGVFAVFSVL